VSKTTSTRTVKERTSGSERKNVDTTILHRELHLRFVYGIYSSATLTASRVTSTLRVRYLLECNTYCIENYIYASCTVSTRVQHLLHRELHLRFVYGIYSSATLTASRVTSTLRVRYLLECNTYCIESHINVHRDVRYLHRVRHQHRMQHPSVDTD
jgi:hypothetical protein